MNYLDDEFDSIDELFSDSSAADAHYGWTNDEIVDFYLGAPKEQIKKVISDFRYAGRDDVCSALKRILK